MKQSFLSKLFPKKEVQAPKQEPFNFEEIVKLDLLYKKDKVLFKQKIGEYSKEQKKSLSRQYVSLANAYMRRETDPEGAMNDLEKALILAPEDQNVMYDLGLFYLEKKMYPEAEEQFHELEKRNKRDTGVLCNLAECYAGLGEYDISLNYLAQAKKIEKEPEKIEIINSTTIHLTEEKKLITGLIQRVTNQPKDLRSRLLVAEFYFSKGRYDDCLKELEPLKSVFDENAEFLFLLGSVLLEKGKLDESLVNLKKVLELKTEFSGMDKLYLTLGEVYEQKGMLDESVTQYTRGLNINPDNVDLYYCRGNIYAQKNMYNEAISDYHTGKQKEMQLEEYKAQD